MGKAQQTKSEEKSARKVSCQPCRSKKVKCDGNKPCARCSAKGVECTFAKPGSVGRPPKNAVVNKLVLTRGNENPKKWTMCKEFIFEHISCPNLPSDADFLYCGRGIGLKFYLDDIFTTYFGAHNAAAQKLALVTSRNKVLQTIAGTFKLYDLKQSFTWDTADIVNVMIRRFSNIKLESYNESEFLQWALVIDHSEDFFTSTPDNHAMINPLNSLPPQQALRLIESFFLIHPYSHLINKTLLLQSYWTDTADPLLLSVIYGTTIYMSRLLEGNPLSLWETLICKSLRNPFLEYAHYLLSKSSAEISVIRYQALIILALFEVTFGYAKRGVSLFALAHIMATKLGVFQTDNIMRSMTAVERETLLWTFWGGFNCTVRGCIELNQVPREVLNRCIHPLPPHSIHVSESHKTDKANGNQRLNKNEDYLVETFYAESVIAQFSAKIFQFYPDTKENLFRQENAYYGKSWSTAVARTPVEVEVGVAQMLQNFAVFIEQHKNEWSALQRYTIEAALLLYSIHFKFLKRHILEARRHSLFEKRDKVQNEFDPNDIENVARMHQALPSAVLLLEKILDFIATNGSQYQEEPQTLPLGILMSSMETCARLFTMKYDRDPWDKKTWLDIQSVYTLATNTIWPEWTSIDVIRRLLREYIEAHADVPFGNTDQTVSDALVLHDPNKIDFDLALSSFSSSSENFGTLDDFSQLGWLDQTFSSFLHEQELDSSSQPWPDTLNQILTLDDDLFDVS